MPREFVCIPCEMLFWDDMQSLAYPYKCPACGAENGANDMNVWATDSTGLAMVVDSVLHEPELTYWPHNVPPGALEHYRSNGIMPREERSATPNILTRAQRIVEEAQLASDGPWEYDAFHMAIYDPYDMVNKMDMAPENGHFITTARNDASAVAQALIDAIDILTRLDQHMDFSIPWEDGVCDECGNGYEDASGVNKAMEDARDFLARMEMTLDA